MSSRNSAHISSVSLCVRFQQTLSSVQNTFTGAPQGTVLSPVLFTLYTNDCCTGTETTPLVKYSDDSALEGLSDSDDIYFEQVKNFSSWCESNYLDFNVHKTKEMVSDFGKNPDPVPDLFINESKVERVSEYKYLGTVIDNKRSFTSNTNFVHKKCQSRIYCLQKLRNIQVSPKILQSFYRCFIESILALSSVCWYGSLSVKNKNVLNKIVNVCCKVVGIRQKSLNEVYESQLKQMATGIMTDSTHTLAHYYEYLPSGKRFCYPKIRTLRFKNSFFPKSIQVLNNSV